MVGIVFSKKNIKIDKIILFTGRLSKEKGVFELIEAMKYIEDTNTIVLFKDTESLLYGETVRFDEWLSNVERFPSTIYLALSKKLSISSFTSAK